MSDACILLLEYPVLIYNEACFARNPFKIGCNAIFWSYIHILPQPVDRSYCARRNRPMRRAYAAGIARASNKLFEN